MQRFKRMICCIIILKIGFFQLFGQASFFYMAEVYSQQKKIDLDSPAQTRSFLLEKEGIICMSVTKESLKVNVSTGVKLSTPQASQIGSQSKASTSTVATEIREVDRWIALTDKGRFLIFGRKKGSLTVAERELEEAEQLKLTSDKKRSFIQTMKDKAKSRPIQELEPAESPKYEMIKMIDHQVFSY